MFHCFLTRQPLLTFTFSLRAAAALAITLLDITERPMSVITLLSPSLTPSCHSKVVAANLHGAESLVDKKLLQLLSR